MTFMVMNKQTGVTREARTELSGVDIHRKGQYVLWYPNEDKSQDYFRYEIIEVDHDTEWVMTNNQDYESLRLPLESLKLYPQYA